MVTRFGTLLDQSKLSVRDFTIRSNINGLGLRSNAIKDLCPLILYQLVVGWIRKVHGLTSDIRAKVIGLSRWSRIVRDFTIRSNTNGLGLRSNAIKDLFPLILVGWIGKAHGPTLRMVEIGRKAKLIWTPESFGQYSHVLELRIALKLNFS